MTASSRKLGKGLGSLLSNRHTAEGDEGIGRMWVAVDELEANPEQPREDMERGLEALAESVRAHGIMQPIVVTPHEEGGYSILAGERRWRAARRAGLKSVPVVIREGVQDAAERLELALIENVQREDLDPIERAKACQRLLREHGLTQDAVAKALGYQRSTVANLVRLLELPAPIQSAVSRGTLTGGHARALLRVRDPATQEEAAKKIQDEDLSVRAAEVLCADLAKGKKGPQHRPRPRKPPWVEELQQKIARRVGARTELRLRARGGGRLVLHFGDLDELDQLASALGAKDESEAAELLES